MLAEQPTQAWSASIGKGSSGTARLNAAPVVGGGKAFTVDIGGQVSAFDAKSGAVAIVPGIEASTLTAGVAAVLVLTFLNLILRPILFVLTLPLTILTLGLFLLVINAAMLGLTAYFLEGFAVSGLIPAVLGSVVISVVVWIGHLVLGQAGSKR